MDVTQCGLCNFQCFQFSIMSVTVLYLGGRFFGTHCTCSVILSLSCKEYCVCDILCNASHILQVKMKSMFAIGFAFTALLSMFNSM